MPGMPGEIWKKPAEDATRRPQERAGRFAGLGTMSAIKLAQAERIIDAIIERGTALDAGRSAVIVVEPGCKVKAFKKEDGASMIRFEMAFGKAYAALALGRSSKLVHRRAEERPIFMRYLIARATNSFFPKAAAW